LNCKDEKALQQGDISSGRSLNQETTIGSGGSLSSQ